jgi:hypothetical protein
MGSYLETWTPLVTHFASAGLSTAYVDSVTHSGSAGFYRMLQK